jgi:hypothetical protein
MPKISELTAVSNVSTDDLLLIVNDPGGAPSTNKITTQNFANSITSMLRYANSTNVGVLRVGPDLSTNSTGYLNLSGTQAIPTADKSEGYVLTWDQVSNAIIWQAFSGVYPFQGVSDSEYIVEEHDGILFVDPNAFSQNITIILPDSQSDPPAVAGKIYSIKNVNPGDGYYVRVTTYSGDLSGSNYLEHPITGEFVVYYDIVPKGEQHDWVFDGITWRHFGSQSGLPVFVGDANTFTEVSLKNKSSGEDASADFVVYNNLGDQVEGIGPYVDIGINSSTYNNPAYSVNGPSDSYVYNIGGDLTIGTANTGTNLILHAGGTTSSDIRLTINSTATSIKNNKVTLDDLSGPYASDSAANAAGIPIKGLYYDASGNVKVRLT